MTETATGLFPIQGRWRCSRTWPAPACSSKRSKKNVSSHIGISFGDYSVLRVLRYSGPPHRLSPKNLADTVVRTTGGMTKIIDRLQRAGLVERLPDPDDRRALLVGLTRKGIRISDKASDAYTTGRERISAPTERSEITRSTTHFGDCSRSSNTTTRGNSYDRDPSVRGHLMACPAADPKDLDLDTPPKEGEAGASSGAGRVGFYLQTVFIPPDFAAPRIHTTTRRSSWWSTVIACSTASRWAAFDCTVVAANEPYGFTSGPKGVQFLVTRNGVARSLLRKVDHGQARLSRHRRGRSRRRQRRTHPAVRRRALSAIDCSG